MRRLIALSFAAAALGTMSPAAAAPAYDAFASFTGTNTGGAFTYGSIDPARSSSFTLFNDTAGCAALISNTICTSNGSLPGAFKSTSGAHLSGTVIVPGNALILHPGPNAGQASAVLFTAPTTSTYRFDFAAFIADNNPSGVNVFAFTPGGFVTGLGTLTRSNLAIGGSRVGFLTAGQQLGVGVDYAGSYFNDSTGVNFTATAVPEPAAWALMIAGFAMTGFAARRRRVALAA